MEKIACLTPTYNRHPNFGWLLEECVESFLRQDYLNKELLICNDTPGQVLKFDHPQVKIFNLPSRFNNLGSKISYMIDHTDADIFARMDDDDCYMPWHLSQAMSRMSTGIEWRPDSHLFFCNDRASLVHRTTNSHISGIFRRRAVELIGGYPYELIGREDQLFNERLIACGIGHEECFLSLGEVSHVYKKHEGIRHLSYREGLNREEQWAFLGNMSISVGEYEIRPHWRCNYVGCARKIKLI